MKTFVLIISAHYFFSINKVFIIFASEMGIIVFSFCFFNELECGV